MNRRRFLENLGVGAAALSLPRCKKSYQKKPGNASTDTRPNILVLISDDQRWDQLSYADNPLIPELKTPNIDKLAQNGAYFRNAFVTTPICCVSRASIMSGRYAGTHGMNHFGTPMTAEVLRKTYPALLHDNGYKTGILGKWGMGIEGTGNIYGTSMWNLNWKKCIMSV
ncbi:MAG: sulfatase-like hydrolase/transferase [Deltaproteobacteria bacterium]|nr:sulfatase-like hydrolase/transferase [Deltaproteobacteria bacterium]